MELFQAFMEHFIQPEDELYILGDFFEVWIGDDDHNPTAEGVIGLLANHSGKKYLMHGNRDFLIGNAFANACNAELLEEPHDVHINGQHWVLMHGDSLCTDDEAYQQFKTMVRNPQWQAEFLAKSLAERQAIAQSMRDQSKQSAQMKAADIMDVAQTTVTETFESTSADVILHGHTHRQNRHQLTINGKAKERIVLGDWGETCSVLVVEQQSVTLQNHSLNDLLATEH